MEAHTAAQHSWQISSSVFQTASEGSLVRLDAWSPRRSRVKEAFISVRCNGGVGVLIPEAARFEPHTLRIGLQRPAGIRRCAAGRLVLYKRWQRDSVT
jgi:hypothetical protein